MRHIEAMQCKSTGQVVGLEAIVRAPEGDGGSKVSGRKPQGEAGPDRAVSLG